ncbi:hypothetical protein [Metabacillus fastidiosus]|uniref:hypothetical protein n=1 Tax=Metabacillus fastidiosus TaxID=1458 RepID=UPI003D27EF9C
MPNSHSIKINTEDHQRLMEWWNTTERAKKVVQELMSLISELRLHPESSHADGMVLFYRAASEISYGYAGMRGCIRRAFTAEYSNKLRENMVMCRNFAHKYSVDTKVLLERVAKQIKGKEGLRLIERIQMKLAENDVMLNEITIRAQTFFCKETLHSMQAKIKQSNMLPK